MNTEILYKHFDRISEAPEAVPRLRRFILDLAVRGKLVEQDPAEEPAAKLLEQIQKRKTKLVDDAIIRKQSDPETVNAEEQPFNIPHNWRWVRFSDIADFLAGRTPARHETSFWNTGDYNWVSIADMIDGQPIYSTKETVSERAKQQIFGAEPLPIGTMIMSFKLTIGKIARLAIPAFHNEAIISIRPHLSSLEAYLFKTLPQFSRQGNKKDAVKGATLNRASLSNILIPLPPLAEQHRIVTKVDELMLLCDQVEASQKKREKRRDRLVSSSLNRFSMASADDVKAATQFHFNHLQRLTSRREHIKPLRDAILCLAVSGHLVLQDTNEESATELLKQIQEEKVILVKERLIKEPKPQPAIKPDEAPYALPTGWKWVRIWDIAQLITSGSRDWAKYYSKTGAMFVTMSNLSRGSYELRLDAKRFVSPPANGEGSRTKLEEDDLLISITGDVGNLGRIPPNFGEAYINQHTCLLRFMPICRNRYFPELLRSPLAKFQFDGPQRGIKNSFRLGDVGEMIIPLPPLAEQHRIVARVDELMTICDQLEKQLTSTEKNNRRLLEAVLSKALASSEEISN